MEVKLHVFETRCCSCGAAEDQKPNFDGRSFVTMRATIEGSTQIYLFGVERTRWCNVENVFLFENVARTLTSFLINLTIDLPSRMYTSLLTYQSVVLTPE